MAEPTVGAGFARGLAGFAVAKGADRSLLLARAGLDPMALMDQDARLPLSSYVALMRAGQVLTGDPALGLHFGERVDIAEVSIIGLLGQASETMQEAFAQLNRYVRLIVETDNGDHTDRFGFTLERGGLWMVDNRRGAEAFPELTESAFAQLVCSARRASDLLVVKAVHLTYPDPGYGQEYERIFQAPVVFGSDWNALQIDPALPDQPVGKLPRYVFGVLSEHAQALLTSLESSKSVRSRVESLLMPILHTGDAGIARIAGKMGLSRQTLFRRLKAEGVTFERVLDDLRHRLALDYLEGTKVSVNETAYLVGFSDPAAFSRAFKRWTGMSPKAARAARRPPAATALRGGSGGER
ncbi:AraC family transcriptional regulator [soil metagenome]